MQSAEQDKADVSEPIQGEVPDASDVFYSELGDELYKKSVAAQNDVLRQLLTTSIALMGGGLVVNAGICDHRLRVAAIVLFFLSVITALIGVHPYRDSVPLGMPQAIKDSLERAASWKDGFIWGCSVFIVLGLTLAFVGVAVK